VGRPKKIEGQEETAVRLLRAAEQAFGAHGYRDARLGDIAAAVGIRRPSLLYYFKTKERLYSAVVERAFAELRDVVSRSLLSGETVEERVDAIAAGLTDFADRRPALVCVIVRQLMAPRSEVREQVVSEFCGLVDTLERVYQDLAGDRIPEALPARSAILQIMSATMLRVATASIEEIWRGRNDTRALARTLLIDPLLPAQ
jgi:AcrR family transcriptional regulator